MSWTILKTKHKARAGILKTAHGEIKTPAFMPVGTYGAVKGIEPSYLEDFDIILANALHLEFRPSSEHIAKMGGLHKFIGWDKAILTDSGGFQVWSMARLRKLTPEGVEFSSPTDGAKLFLTPQKAVENQRNLGSDIAMVLDHCPPFDAPKAGLKQAVELSAQWAKRGLVHWHSQPATNKLFAITQGGLDPDLRKLSVQLSTDTENSPITPNKPASGGNTSGGSGFDGYAIGGLSVGEDSTQMLEIAELTADLLPTQKPRYLMGVGRPEELTKAVKSGIDLFDCVLPTRSGRFGKAFTTEGELNLRNSKFKGDTNPLQQGCRCPACQKFSRGYIRHLLQVGEMLGGILLSLHNLTFYGEHMRKLREEILE